MKMIHLANTDFEFELAYTESLSIEQSWARHPLCLQLQFVPLLYAKPGDVIAVTSFPNRTFIRDFQKLDWRRQEELPGLALLEEEEPFWEACCQSWGPSQRVLEWAQKRRADYKLPPWETVCRINSKAFSFKYTRLKEAALIYQEKELLNWLKEVSGPKVLKTCFGLSGKGNRLVHEHAPTDSLLAFCRKEWELGRPIVAEPWVERCFDFSTQWIVHPDGRQELLGATVFETDSHGSYQATLAGPQEILFRSHKPFLDEHILVVESMLKDLSQMGFFGHVGVDALLYWHEKNREIRLYPIVEINGRQTMSLAALRLQQRWFVDQAIRFSFVKADDPRPSLLPTGIERENQAPLFFKRKLIVEDKPS